MRKMTQTAYDRIHGDFKGMSDGTPHVLMLDRQTGATVSRAVEIVPEPDAAQRTALVRQWWYTYLQTLRTPYTLPHSHPVMREFLAADDAVADMGITAPGRPMPRD